MKKFLSNYKTTIILLVAIIVGAIVGIIFQEKATILQPLGDIFLNLLLVVIVPLVFLTITTSIAKMENPKRLGKIMITIIVVFAVTSLIAVLVGFASTYFIKLVNPEDGEKIKTSLEETGSAEESDEEEVTIADRTVQLLTVNDFSKLLSKDNIIAILVASIICGIAISFCAALIGVILGGLDFSGLAIKVGNASIKYGSFIQSVIDFLIVAVCIFTMIKFFEKFKKKEVKKEEPVKTSEEILLLREIRDSLKKKK